MKNYQIVAALEARIQEYNLMLGVDTGNADSDNGFEHAMNIIIEDMRNLIIDLNQASTHSVAVIRHLHAIN